MTGSCIGRLGLIGALAVAAMWSSACAPAQNADKLLADLTNPDLEVRQEAADALETIIQKNEHDVFVRALSSPNMLTRAQSIVYLSRMTSPPAREALRGLLATDRRMMLPFNPVRLRPQSEMTDSRILVATLIQRTGPDPRAITLLLDGADSEQTSDMLAGTCFAVGALRDPAGIPFLARAARHPDPAVVRAAVQALGQFSTDEALAALKIASTHPVTEVRSDVLSALSSRDDGAARAILMDVGRDDPQPELRASAWQILSRFKGDDIVPYFIDRLGDAPDVARPTLVEILQRLTGQNLGPKRDAWARYWSNHVHAPATAKH